MITTTASAWSQGRWRATKRQSTEERSEGDFLVLLADAAAAAAAGGAAAAEADAAAAVGRSLFFFLKEAEEVEVEGKASTQRVASPPISFFVSFLSLSRCSVSLNRTPLWR